MGGLLPLYTRLKEVELRYLVGFASGLMISIAFFDMLPEIKPENVNALAIGFFFTYLLEKFVMIHSCGERECESHTIGWTTLIGIAAESLVDGAAIATGYAVAPALGLTIALAVFVHEMPRGFSTTVIMRQSNYGNPLIYLALFIDAGFTPLGVILAHFFPPGLFTNLLAFSAGTFIYVGASDLLPEAHRRFNIQVVICVLAGALLVPLLERLF